MRGAVLILGLAVLCSPAAAQRPGTRAAAQPPPAATAEPQRTTATFADWTLRCVRPETAAATCEVTQTVFDKAQQPVAQTAIGRLAAGEPLRLTLLVPSNIALATSPRLQPGDGDGAELAWRRCLPAGCLADLTLSEELIRRLRARTEPGRLVYQDGGDHERVIPFVPRGLGQALDALAKESG